MSAPVQDRGTGEPAVDVRFPCMGSDVRLLLEPVGAAAGAGAADARAYLDAFDARLSRFRPDSELTSLNEDPHEAVPVSGLLATAVAAGRWGAERTGGLVDPTLVGALRSAGYASTRRGVAPASLADALAAAPPRRAARPDPAARWRNVEVDREAGVVRRPPGLELDTGGTGKGLAADAVVHRLRGLDRVLVDCGGDIAVGGASAQGRPWRVEVAHPLTGDCVHVVPLDAGGVATSGVDARVWRHGDGYAHHLLDPSTGEPAWTGLIAVTALGTTALDAEVLAKAALLSGANAARRVLRERGGVIVHEDGDVELVGPLRPRPVVRLRVRSAAADLEPVA